LWCWDLRGSFFPGFAALEQDRHWLDCVTRTEGALVEKAGLHPLALGPNRKLYGLIPTRAVIAGDLARPDHSINLLAPACYTPKTNGKAERFIQTALREWAYAQAYPTSNDRAAALPIWLHRYNWHRPHSSLQSKSPISRLALTEDNLLRLHT
jgi:hypothetical protein